MAEDVCSDLSEEGMLSTILQAENSFLSRKLAERDKKLCRLKGKLKRQNQALEDMSLICAKIDISCDGEQKDLVLEKVISKVQKECQKVVSKEVLDSGEESDYFLQNGISSSSTEQQNPLKRHTAMDTPNGDKWYEQYIKRARAEDIPDESSADESSLKSETFETLTQVRNKLCQLESCEPNKNEEPEELWNEMKHPIDLRKECPSTLQNNMDSVRKDDSAREDRGISRETENEDLLVSYSQDIFEEKQDEFCEKRDEMSLGGMLSNLESSLDEMQSRVGLLHERNMVVMNDYSIMKEDVKSLERGRDYLSAILDEVSEKLTLLELRMTNQKEKRKQWIQKSLFCPEQIKS